MKYLITVIAFLLLLSKPCFSADPQTEAQNTYYTYIHPKTSSKSSVQDFLAPLHTDTSMQTFDGSKTFDARIQGCPGGNILKLAIFPSATGDFSLQVQADFDFDGSYEKNWNFSNISGACTKGYVTCSPGTWSDCHYYKWTFDGEDLSSQEVSYISGEAGVCFCTNASCGSPVVTSTIAREQTLETLAAGILAAIQTEIPSFQTGKATVSDYTIAYTGLYAGGCTSAPYPYGETDPSHYYPDTYDFPYSAELTSQSSDPASPYYQVTTTVEVAGVSTETHTCEITRVASVSTGTIPATHTITALVGTIGDNYWEDGIYSASKTVNIASDEAVTAARICNMGWDDAIKIYVNSGLVWSDWPGCYERSTSFTYSGCISIIIDHFISGVNTLSETVCAAGEGEGWFYYELDIGPNCSSLTALPDEVYRRCEFSGYEPEVDRILLNTTDDCSTLESDPDCQLLDEEICDQDGLNCVYTVKNGVLTGLTPSGSCYGISGSVDYYTLCASGDKITVSDSTGTTTLLTGEKLFWRIKRIYRCTANETYDFTEAIERSQTVVETTQYNSSTGEFTGYTDPLAPVPEIDIGFQTEYEQCTYTCVVNVQLSDTRDYPGSNPKEITPYNYYQEVRECYLNSGEYICPLESGETVAEGCTCRNDFNRALAIMQTVDDASHDLTCSSVPP